jgi:hypothetical protein
MSTFLEVKQRVDALREAGNPIPGELSAQYEKLRPRGHRRLPREPWVSHWAKAKHFRGLPGQTFGKASKGRTLSGEEFATRVAELKIREQSRAGENA